MSRHARKILNLLTLAAFTVSCTDATEPESIDVASQVVLTEPPYRYETGGFDERWMWSFESTLPQVRLSRRTSTDGQDLAIPGAAVLYVGTRDVGGARYLLVGALDAQEAFTLYRYEDVDGDGAPDTQSEEALLDTGAGKAYITDIAWDGAGSAYMLDRRCQDVWLARDSDADGWADDVQASRFAMSDDHAELLPVVDIEADSIGTIRAYRMAPRPDRDRLSPHWVFSDTNQDGKADAVVPVPALDMPIVIRGRPFHGQATLEVRGRPGAEVEVWKLDSDLEKTALTGSATIESDLEAWTDVHLGTSLAADDLIGVQYQGDDASMVFDTVWADWPQIIGFDSLVARVGGSGGSLGLLGYNFTSDMTVELRTTDGALHDLAVTFNSATSATVELPALATDQLGPGTLYCISPGQDVDTHGASIAHITICEEAEE